MFSNLQRDLPLPVAAMLISLLLPPELSIELGGLRLSGYRIVLLIMFVPMLYALMLRPGIRMSYADWGMIFVSVWSLLALVVHEGLVEAIEKGGILIVEMFGSYLVARIYITRYQQLLAVAKLLTMMVAFVLIVSIPESLSGIHFLRGSGITIYPERLGLHRAYGPFDHPILHGVVCASVFSYVHTLVSADKKVALGRWTPALIVCAATFLSLSAGPFIALGTQIGLAFWDHLSKKLKNRWWIVLGTLCFCYIAIDLFSNRSPVALLISYLSFSGQTAYMRLHIFDYGSAEALRHPWLGIGYGDWLRPSWMPPSVDNFWLLTAMRYGMPASFGIIAVMVYMALRIGGMAATIPIRDAGRAWGFTLAGFALVGCTVHFWNATFVLFFFFLGSGNWIFSQKKMGCDSPRLRRAPRISAYRARSTLF